MVLSHLFWLHFGHQGSQGLAVAPVLATLRTPSFSGSCCRLGLGCTPDTRLLRIVLSPGSWPHSEHQASQARDLASVLATLRAPGFSGPCCRLGPGHTSGTKLFRVVLSPRSCPHIRASRRMAKGKRKGSLMIISFQTSREDSHVGSYRRSNYLSLITYYFLHLTYHLLLITYYLLLIFLIRY